MAIFEDPVTGEVIRFEDGTTEAEIQERLCSSVRSYE